MLKGATLVLNNNSTEERYSVGKLTVRAGDVSSRGY